MSTDRSRWDAFYAGDPNDSELGRFPAPSDLPVRVLPHRAYVNETKHKAAAVGSFDWAYYCTREEFEWWIAWTVEYWQPILEPPTFGAYGRMLQETAAYAKRNAERSSGQWCTLHNRHQDDPEHDYQWPTCETYLRETTVNEERAQIRDMWHDPDPDFPPW